MKLLRLTILIGILVSLFGCSANGKKFENIVPAKENSGVVYLFRPWVLAAGATAPIIMINGAGEYKLKNGGYYRFELPSGIHRFEVMERIDPASWKKWRKHGISIDVQNGREHYIYYKVTGSIGLSTMTFKFGFNEVDEEIAIPMLLETKALMH